MAVSAELALHSATGPEYAERTRLMTLSVSMSQTIFVANLRGVFITGFQILQLDAEQPPRHLFIGMSLGNLHGAFVLAQEINLARALRVGLRDGILGKLFQRHAHIALVRFRIDGQG